MPNELQAAEAEARDQLREYIDTCRALDSDAVFWMAYGALEEIYVNAIRATALAAVLAENPAPAARYRDEAMVERVAEALKQASLLDGLMPNVNHWDVLARAALAVITEPADGNSTVRG